MWFPSLVIPGPSWRSEVAVTASPGYGSSDGGIVLDLSAMKAVDVDPESRTAWAQAGLTAGESPRPSASMALPSGSATPVPWGSAESPSEVEWGSSPGSMASPSTLSSPPSWSPPTARSSSVDAENHPGSLLGDSGWGRKLRSGDQVPVPAPRSRRDRGRDADPSRHTGHHCRLRRIGRSRPPRSSRRSPT